MIKKSQLAITLEKLDRYERPSVLLEQYTIPGDLAAEILVFAGMHGDITGKRVADLGCGTGRLAIGAALLDAESVVGVDIDEDAISIARKNLDKITGIHCEVEFFCDDVASVDIKADAVLQNPPFGIKNRYADRVFLEKAVEIAPIVYTLHARGTERGFIEKYGLVTNEIEYDFSIPRQFSFHRKRIEKAKVVLYRLERIGKRFL